MKFEDIKSIGDAINFYKSDESKRVIETIQGNRNINYLNHNYANALCLTDVMFRNAKKQICILAGDNIFHFLNILKEPFKMAYDSIMAYAGEIRIIALGTEASFNESTKSHYKRFKETFCNVQLRRGVIKDPLEFRHYIICDNDVRIEEPHFPVDLTSPADRIRATVYFNANPDDVEILKGKFNSIFAKVSSA